ncbi:carboxymuconolactone decarboxylase family protein [Rhodococcus sp. HNM0569]|nr:carboxymuconolactone decarboxylase family protein [Rhodococcus sp. HNM0569]
MAGVVAQVRTAAEEAGLDRRLLELVNVRVSQINRCAYCLDLHSVKAYEAGETEQRLAVLPAWREVDLFTPREQAALEIAETVTLVADAHLDDAAYAPLRRHLDDDQISVLVWAAVTINAYNRVSILSGHRVRERGGR